LSFRHGFAQLAVVQLVFEQIDFQMIHTDLCVSEVDVEEGKVPDMFGGLKIYDLVTQEKAKRTLQDTEKFIEYLHRELAAKRKRSNPYDVTFVGRALHFPLASASGSTRHPR
jgi:hypothetical protein